MKFRANKFKAALLGPAAACLVCGGCLSPQPAPPPEEPPRVIVVADGGQPIAAAELDELTRAFADSYVGVLYSACDAVRQGNLDPVQRREAQTLLIDCSTNIYDIVSNADAFTRLLDLVVVTRLMAQVWVADGRAERVFGDRAGPVADAMLRAREETQSLAERVLTVQQLGVLESLIVEWRTENPEMVRVSFVRFSNFAVGRGRTAASEVLAARGFLAEVGQAGQAVDEARLLSERIFYQLKREPTLLRWQAAAAKDDLLATPEVASALADLHRLTDQAEQLPAHFAAEREAVLAAVDSRMAGADGTVTNIRDALAEAESLVASLDPASESLEQMFTTADGLLARYDAWHRWAAANRKRPFDIRDYTELVVESATTAQEVDDLLGTTGELVASPDWDARIDEWNQAADGRIELLAARGRRLVDDFFSRFYVALGVLFVLLVCYRVISVLLVRRLTPRG